MTTTEEFNTAADAVFVGDDADLFLGVAMNLLFAKTDVLTVDGCTIQRSEKVRFGADGAEPFETVYLYTASHIENILIPQLENLGELDPDNVAIFNSYAANWENHLALNDELRDSALENVLENRSFSAGAGYSYSHESTLERSFGWEVGVNSELEASTQLGFKVAGSGVTATFSASLSFESSFGGSVGNEATVSTGYTLSDNDPGDYFSVDIASDPVFGTPVFRNVSGASSCPHEFNTQPRDSIFVAIEPNILHNVPLDTPAEFVLSMVNESVSQEAREYQLRAIQASNLGGAVIKVNGTLLDDGLSFFLDPGVTQVATLTVEQGPSQFFYNGLQIQAVAPCEYENWENGGTLAAADTISFSVNFEASCSDVALVQPTSGWNYNIGDAAANNDTLSFLIDGFVLETSAPDSINSVGAQYRLVDTETWITIDEIMRADVPVYDSNHAQAGEPMGVSIDWVLPTLLPDGQYELRAFTDCDNGVGGSIPATGRLDRHSPEVFGSPQPSDDSLALGDDISITFNESIDCTTVSGLTVVMAVAGGDTITTATTCNGTTVSISAMTPSLDQLEGETLNVFVSGIKDLAGNTLVGTTTWQFTVTRNGFAWVEADIYKSAAFQSPGIISGALVNGSGADINFNLTNVPAWLTPVAASGTVIAGQTQDVHFTIDPLLAEGSHLATLQAVSVPPGLSAELNVRVDIGCQVPDWTIDPADYQHSMTAVISLEVDGTLTEDPNDILVGFVGNQVRGIAHVELVTEINPNRYLAFMNLYSNMVAGENIRFQVFDASECRLYNSTDNYISFVADERQGFPEGPFALVAMDVAAPDQQTIALNQGWTMFSLSLVDSLDMSVVNILGDLNPGPSDIIKSRTLYSEFDQTLGWQGSLSDLDLRESYSINLSEAGNLVHSGVPVDFDTPIYLIDGWNWIGYLQTTGQTVNAGMADWSPSNGDLLKSQSSFSEYVTSADSWIGNLNNFAPGVGYKLFVDSAVTSGALQYAEAALPLAGIGVFTLDPRLGPVNLADNKSYGFNLPDWQPNEGHEYNMTVTSVVDVDNHGAGLASGIVGAFAGEELRGYSELIYIPQLGQHIAFLMVHSNEVEGETISLRFYDSQTDAGLPIEETIVFGADQRQGILRDPVVLHAYTSEMEIRPTAFSFAPAFPNPANLQHGTTISWAMPKSAHVALRVYDVRGRMVKDMVNEVREAGVHTHHLNTRQMASGVYFLRLVAGDFSQTRKMMVVK
ncbi:MAG: T9SS type A sorting domain-containing protein [Gammaproteobacteria bacterium]|nr:T9SS type A sorting domain-containing protein [Gammaproteobacteria bacterium]